MIKDVEKISKYSFPLISGDSNHTSIILGDLTMEPDQIIENLIAVEEQLRLNFKWATGKLGKASANDKLNYVVCSKKKFQKFCLFLHTRGSHIRAGQKTFFP